MEISFPKKIWYSITKFEKYPDMAQDGIFKAVRYLITMAIIVTTFALCGSMIKMNIAVGNLAPYIEQNIPDFTFEDGKVSMELTEPMVINDIANSQINKVIINPIAETSEQKEELENKETIVGTNIYFFKDEIILKNKVDDEHIQTQNYTYKDFIANYTKEDIQNFNKADLIEFLRSEKMTPFYTSYATTMFIYLLLTDIIYLLLDTFRIAVFGWITAVVAKIKMKFSAIYNMAIYSFTLPMILNIIYLIVNYFIDFKIKYFEVAYTTIAYIYLAAAIFILKDDFIKKMQEVMKIRQEQKNVREEIKRQEEEKKEKKDKDDDKDEGKDENEDKDTDTPEGSEA